MKISTSPADARPFQCRADLERERELDGHYRRLGIASVVAAVSQRRPAKDRPKNLPDDTSSND